MIYLALVLLGLSLGSFVNALVWRIYKQEEVLAKKPTGVGKKLKELSIVQGRSMCMHCRQELAPKDLIPVLSWVYLRGKCRYCKKSIPDTPFTELILPLLFIVSYIAWPFASNGWTGMEMAAFGMWLLVLTCYVALAVYDAKWYLLPDRIVWPVTVFAFAMMTFLAAANSDESVLVSAVGSGLLISGVFFLLAYISKGTWIGGGDIKLGLSLGLIAGNPLMAVLLVFLASLFGSLAALPTLISGKRGLNSMLPFGPFLITAAVIVFLWGPKLYDWYFGLLV